MNKYSEKRFLASIQEIEELDARFRKNGISEEYKKKWGVEHNVGIWSIGRWTAELLALLISLKKPKAILELGTSIGYSTMWLARAAQEYGGEVYTIEKEDYKVKSAKEYFDKVGFENIHQIHGEASEVLKDWEREVDFVFLDAHKFLYHEYLALTEPYLKKGAIVVADNALDFAEKIEKYREMVFESGKYQSTLLDIDHGVIVSVFN